MAKAVKIKEVVAITDSDGSVLWDSKNAENKKEPISMPDIPEQLWDDKNVLETFEQIVCENEIQISETDEILFLRKILDIQQSGCFGRHLDQLINERIKELKK